MWSKFDNDVLDIPVDVCQAIEKRQWESSAVKGLVHLDVVVWTGVSHDISNDASQVINSQHLTKTKHWDLLTTH